MMNKFSNALTANPNNLGLNHFFVAKRNEIFDKCQELTKIKKFKKA